MNNPVDSVWLNSLDKHIVRSICSTLKKYAKNEHFFWHNTDKSYHGNSCFPCEGDFRAYLMLELCSAAVNGFALHQVPDGCQKPWIHAEANFNLGSDRLARYADIIISNPFAPGTHSNDKVLRIIETKMNFHQFTKKSKKGSSFENDMARIMGVEKDFIRFFPGLPVRSYFVVIQGGNHKTSKYREWALNEMTAAKPRGLVVYYVDELSHTVCNKMITVS